VTPRAKVNVKPQEHNLNNCGRGPLDDDPVTYLCNNFGRGPPRDQFGQISISGSREEVI